MEDIFPVIVQSVSGDGQFTEVPVESVVSVIARSGSEAQLVAMEIVGCRRTPVSSKVDWDNF